MTGKLDGSFPAFADTWPDTVMGMDTLRGTSPVPYDLY